MYFVYELVDPRTNVTGYVGITNNPNQRYSEHVEGRVGKGRKYEWIQHLQEERAQPKMKILEIVDNPQQARKREQYWIQHYVSKGIKLANTLLIQTSKTQTTLTEARNRTISMNNQQQISRKKAPSANLYTRSEAIKKLGIPKSTFHDYVTTGRIQKVVPPGRKEGYYLKKEIDELSRATQLFILQYTLEPTSFETSIEKDIEVI